MSDMKNVYTGAFGKVNTPREQFEIMSENYSGMCLEYAGICRRYRSMLDDKDRDNVKLREELIKLQNTISDLNRQIRSLQGKVNKTDVPQRDKK